MPLKTKRSSQPPKKTRFSTTGKGQVPAQPRKTVAKASGKSSAFGKRPMKGAGRTSAGYELYSSDSDEQPAALRRAWPQQSLSAPVTTLVEDWMARQSDDSVKNMSGDSQSMERRKEGCVAPAPGKTLFNKRLVSSTPDPELLNDEEEQLIPERDGSARAAASMLDLARLGAVGQGQVVLTETEREQLRQQIDAVLQEEAEEIERLQKGTRQLHQLQHSLPAHQPPQKRVFPQTDSPPNPTSLGQQTAADHNTNTNNIHQEAKGDHSSAAVTWGDIMSDQGLLNRGSDIGVFHHFLHRDSADGVPPAFQAGVGDKTSSSCKLFVPQPSASVAPNFSMGFVPVGERTGAFSLLSSGASGDLNGQYVSSRSGLQPLSVSTESSRLDEQVGVRFQTVSSHSHSGQVHQATPASSPVRHQSDGVSRTHHASRTDQKARHSSDRQGSKVMPTGRVGNRIDRVVEQELQTPATSPEEAAGGTGQERRVSREETQRRQDTTPKSSARNTPAPGSRAIRGRSSQENSTTSQGKDKKASGKAGKGSDRPHKRPLGNANDNYTSDGYFINSSEHSQDENDFESPPEPRSFPPTPMRSPHLPSGSTALSATSGSLEMPVHQSDQRPLNTNNSSDTYFGQGEVGQRRRLYRRGKETPAPQSACSNTSHSIPNFLSYMRPAREAMAEADMASLPVSVARAMMMMAEDQDCDDQEPPTPAPSPTAPVFHSRDVQNGPRKLRHLLYELKQICAIDGDMEVGQLLQEVIELVEIMPQLKVTFNLQAEIDLALQPLRNENSQLRRRLRILNQQLKERERREKEDSNPGMNFEMLHLQTENASLQRQLKEEREGCKKLSQYISEQQQQMEKAGKEMQLIQTKLSEKEHDKVLARQEYTQDLNRLHQEVEMMSRRNESVQLKLASADRENNILQLNLKQRDMEIARLHTVLGNLKQGVTEVLQYFDQSVGDLNTSDAGIQKLLAFLRSSSQAYNPPKDDLLSTSSGQGTLERSGNQRARRPCQPDGEPAGTHAADSSRHVSDSSRHVADSSRHGSSSSLTVEALAAHNRHLEPIKDKAENFVTGANFSHHSWDGVDLQRSLAGSKSLLYHSDPESVGLSHRKASTSAFLHHHHQLKRDNLQQEDPQKKQQQMKAKECHDHNQSHRSLGASVVGSTDIGQSKARSQSYDETFGTLSEVTIPETEKLKAGEFHDSLGITQNSHHSVTNYFKKHPGSRMTEGEPCSLPPSTSTSLTLTEVSAPTDTQSSSTVKDIASTQGKSSSSSGQHQKPKEPSPPISSPNTSLTFGALENTQRDYFHGTELDLSLSTIQEDAASTITGTTMGSIATAMSLDDRAFREGIATLDENIAKVHEALQRTKKMFS